MKNRIRTLRLEKGITMKQLGSELGVAESTISQYETGKRQPDNETLLKLGEYFDVTVGYLLGVDEKKPVTNEGNGLSEDEQYIINVYRKLSRQGKAYVLQTVDMAANTFTGDSVSPQMEDVG